MRTGIARFEYRHFVVFGAQSEFSALSTECGADQGAFWQFHDAYMSGNAALYTRTGAIGLAEDLGLDGETFTSCLENEVHLGAIEAGQREARQAGVGGTPTLTVNGQRVEASAEAVIEAARAAAGR